MIATASFSTSWAGSASGDALSAAAYWLQALLLGSVASIVAIVAIAVVGLMMLSGRIDIRRGVIVVLGCFLLFGAPTISAGLRDGLAGDAAQSTLYFPDHIAISPPPLPKPMATPAPYDPYAGASLRTGN